MSSLIKPQFRSLLRDLIFSFMTQLDTILKVAHTVLFYPLCQTMEALIFFLGNIVRRLFFYILGALVVQMQRLSESYFSFNV